MNLNQRSFRHILLGFFLLGLVLVGGDAFAADQVASSCVTNNCDSSPLSCTNEMVLTAGQLECERLRSDNPEEFLGPNGYCGCISSLGAKTAGAGYMFLSPQRMSQLEDWTLNSIIKDFALQYIEDSRNFSDLYFSAKTASFYQENEIEAFVMDMPLEKLNALSASEKAAKIAEAKTHIASCSGTRLYDEMKAQSEEGFCQEAGPRFIDAVISHQTSDNDSYTGFSNFSQSLSKTGMGPAEIKARFIEFSSTSVLVNNEMGAAIIGDQYATLLSNIQSGKPVKREELLNLEEITKRGMDPSTEGAKEVMGKILTNLVALTAGVEGPKEYDLKMKEIESYVQMFPSYAKLIRVWGGEGNQNIKKGVESFIAANKKNTDQIESGELVEYYKGAISASQRDMFLKSIVQCKRRENIRKSLCEVNKPGGHGTHINDFGLLTPESSGQYAERILANNRLPEDERALLRQHLDILSCASNAPSVALCKRGTGSRTNKLEGRLDEYAHLDFTTMFLNERRECTAGLGAGLFYTGWRESDKAALLARNTASSEGTPWGAEVGTESAGSEQEVVEKTAQTEAAKAFTGTTAVVAGLSSPEQKSGGLFNDISTPVKEKLSKRYALRDGVISRNRGNSYPRVLGSTSSNIGSLEPIVSSGLSSASPASVSSRSGRSPASISSSIGEMVSSTLKSNPFSNPSTSNSLSELSQSEPNEIVSELVDDEGNLTSSFSELSPDMSDREKNLIKEISSLKSELAKIKKDAKERDQLSDLSDELEREAELKAELEKKSAALKTSLVQSSLNDKKNGREATSISRAGFTPPRVLGPVSNIPAPSGTVAASLPSYQGSTFSNARLNDNSVANQAAASSVSLNRSALSNSTGLILVASGDGFFKVEGASDPSALSADNFASIKSALAGSTSQVVVEFPDGRKFIYTENPETNELIQTQISELSLADLKRLDDRLEQQEDPVARSPASVVELQPVDTTPSRKWSDVITILKDSGATNR